MLIGIIDRTCILNVPQMTVFKKLLALCAINMARKDRITQEGFHTRRYSLVTSFWSADSSSKEEVLSSAVL